VQPINDVFLWLVAGGTTLMCFERKLLIHGGLFIARETTVSRSLISQMNRTQELAIVSKKRDEIVAHRVKQTKPPVISVIRFL
jgi:hypothetical protein